MTIALTLLAVASVAIGILDLVRKSSADVLRTAATFEIGFLLGAAGQLFFPAAFPLGALAGFVLAAVHLDRVARTRVETLDAQLVAAPDAATSLLTLHDRIDALAGGAIDFRQGSLFLALLFTLLFAVGLIAIGLGTGVWPALLVGSLWLFTPVAQGARMLVEYEERRALRARLADEGYGGLDLLDARTG